MQAKIKKVDDGFGLLLPKELLDACGFGEEVNVTVRDKTLVVTAKEPARAAWENTCRFRRRSCVPSRGNQDVFEQAVQPEDSVVFPCAAVPNLDALRTSLEIGFQVAQASFGKAAQWERRN